MPESAKGGLVHSLRAPGPAWGYVAPFVGYVLVLGLQPFFPVDLRWNLVLRGFLCSALLLLYSRKVVGLRPSHIAASFLVGAVAFGLWIAPDLLWPGYRAHWLFANPIFTTSRGSLPLAIRTDPLFLFLRVANSVLLVPIVEELFWRAWLMRRLISFDFQKVPLGTFRPAAFWGTAVLFALEHGVYWDVGLAAGIIYNYWAVRTRSIADCILAHAVTNALLAAYVITAGKWSYWL